MSTIPGAIRATLDVLLDHINADPQDPTRPDTLTVWESREDLAAETGFSTLLGFSGDVSILPEYACSFNTLPSSCLIRANDI